MVIKKEVKVRCILKIVLMNCYVDPEKKYIVSIKSAKLDWRTFGDVAEAAIYPSYYLNKIDGSTYIEKYQFDKKISELEENNKWQVLELKKSSYIVNKDIESWLCIAKKK